MKGLGLENIGGVRQRGETPEWRLRQKKIIECQVANKHIQYLFDWDKVELAYLIIFAYKVDYVILINIMEKSSTPSAFLCYWLYVYEEVSINRNINLSWNLVTELKSFNPGACPL